MVLLIKFGGIASMLLEQPAHMKKKHLGLLKQLGDILTTDWVISIALILCSSGLHLSLLLFL